MAEIARHMKEVDPNDVAHWTDLAWAERSYHEVTVAAKTLLSALERLPEEAHLLQTGLTMPVVKGLGREGAMNAWQTPYRWTLNFGILSSAVLSDKCG